MVDCVDTIVHDRSFQSFSICDIEVFKRTRIHELSCGLGSMARRYHAVSSVLFSERLDKFGANLANRASHKYLLQLT
jgi:hypothetical protein